MGKKQFSLGREMMTKDKNDNTPILKEVLVMEETPSFW